MVDVPARSVAFHLGCNLSDLHYLEFPMPVPTIDRMVLTEGLIGLVAAFSQMTDAKIALLAELVPERGEALWTRFRTWQRSSDEDVGFMEWFKAVVAENVTIALYPSGCTLDTMTRRMLASEVIRVVGARNDEDLLNVHFAVEPQYGRARAVSCRGCPVTKCRHNLRL